jgi:hypothetical protein
VHDLDDDRLQTNSSRAACPPPTLRGDYSHGVGSQMAIKLCGNVDSRMIAGFSLGWNVFARRRPSTRFCGGYSHVRRMAR